MGWCYRPGGEWRWRRGLGGGHRGRELHAQGVEQKHAGGGRRGLSRFAQTSHVHGQALSYRPGIRTHKGRKRVERLSAVRRVRGGTDRERGAPKNACTDVGCILGEAFVVGADACGTCYLTQQNCAPVRRAIVFARGGKGDTGFSANSDGRTGFEKLCSMVTVWRPRGPPGKNAFARLRLAVAARCTPL